MFFGSFLFVLELYFIKVQGLFFLQIYEFTMQFDTFIYNPQFKRLNILALVDYFGFSYDILKQITDFDTELYEWGHRYSEENEFFNFLRNVENLSNYKIEDWLCFGIPVKYLPVIHIYCAENLWNDSESGCHPIDETFRKLKTSREFHFYFISRIQQQAKDLINGTY